MRSAIDRRGVGQPISGVVECGLERRRLGHAAKMILSLSSVVQSRTRWGYRQGKDLRRTAHVHRDRRRLLCHDDRRHPRSAPNDRANLHSRRYPIGGDATPTSSCALSAHGRWPSACRGAPAVAPGWWPASRCSTWVGSSASGLVVGMPSVAASWGAAPSPVPTAVTVQPPAAVVPSRAPGQTPARAVVTTVPRPPLGVRQSTLVNQRLLADADRFRAHGLDRGPMPPRSRRSSAGSPATSGSPAGRRTSQPGPRHRPCRQSLASSTGRSLAWPTRDSRRRHQRAAYAMRAGGCSVVLDGLERSRHGVARPRRDAERRAPAAHPAP